MSTRQRPTRLRLQQGPSALTSTPSRVPRRIECATAACDCDNCVAERQPGQRSVSKLRLGSPVTSERICAARTCLVLSELDWRHLHARHTGNSTRSSAHCERIVGLSGERCHCVRCEGTPRWDAMRFDAAVMISVRRLRATRRFFLCGQALHRHRSRLNAVGVDRA